MISNQYDLEHVMGMSTIGAHIGSVINTSDVANVKSIPEKRLPE